MSVVPTILEVEGLQKWFPIRRGLMRKVVGQVRAVDGVGFEIRQGETLALVGESGCGKTTTSRCILRALTPTGGAIRFRTQDGRQVDIAKVPKPELRPLRRQMQMIFQDPFSSLNPRMTIMDIVGEPLLVNGMSDLAARRTRVRELLEVVQLPAQYLNRFPHAFSGGQRQRIGIARAIALNPEFIVCDEPVSALDVSIQSQILNLLNDLQDELKIAYLFIAHNLAVVEHFSDDVAVMYLGRIVEKASGHELYTNPKHPYTESLLSAVPEPDPRRKKRRIVLGGEVPSPAKPPTGCPFHPRCPLTRIAAQQANASETVEITSGGESFRVLRKCVEEVPPLEQKQGEPGHLAACWVTK